MTNCPAKHTGLCEECSRLSGGRDSRIRRRDGLGPGTADRRRQGSVAARGGVTCHVVCKAGYLIGGVCDGDGMRAGAVSRRAWLHATLRCSARGLADGCSLVLAPRARREESDHGGKTEAPERVVAWCAGKAIAVVDPRVGGFRHKESLGRPARFCGNRPVGTWVTIRETRAAEARATSPCGRPMCLSMAATSARWAP